MDISQLEAIIKLLKLNEVTEFELEQDGTKLKLVRGSTLTLQPVGIAGTQAVAHSVEPAVIPSSPNGTVATHSASTPAQPQIPASWIKVESPIVGTFYSRPSPDADTYVKEGALVKKGDTLCIIEAMKLMNEIEAPQAGRIQKVLLGDGQVVEYGEALFFIDPQG